MEVESFYHDMSEPEGYGTFDQDNRLPESHCPICLEGENDKDIKVCAKCQELLNEIS